MELSEQGCLVKGGRADNDGHSESIFAESHPGMPAAEDTCFVTAKEVTGRP
jgi:hypothetical protein